MPRRQTRSPITPATESTARSTAARRLSPARSPLPRRASPPPNSLREPTPLRLYYGGGGGYDPGTSPDLTETVAQAPPVVTLTATPTPSAAGQSVTVTASVPPGADGDITFMNGTTTLDTVTASSGDALSFSQYSSTNCVERPGDAQPELADRRDKHAAHRQCMGIPHGRHEQQRHHLQGAVRW